MGYGQSLAYCRNTIIQTFTGINWNETLMKRKVDENTDENVGVICKHLRGLEEIECLLLTAINELEKNSERLRIRKLKVAASIKKKSQSF